MLQLQLHLSDQHFITYSGVHYIRGLAVYVGRRLLMEAIITLFAITGNGSTSIFPAALEMRKQQYLAYRKVKINADMAIAFRA